MKKTALPNFRCCPEKKIPCAENSWRLPPRCGESYWSMMCELTRYFSKTPSGGWDGGYARRPQWNAAEGNQTRGNDRRDQRWHGQHSAHQNRRTYEICRQQWQMCVCMCSSGGNRISLRCFLSWSQGEGQAKRKSSPLWNVRLKAHLSCSQNIDKEATEIVLMCKICIPSHKSLVH